MTDAPSSNASPLRIGLLGAAAITPRAIVEPASQRDDVQLTVIAARDVSRAEAFSEAHGVARTEADYTALVTAPDVDLVYNALPVSGHAPWTIRALRAGKHVLCEKPLAMNAGEARAMQKAAHDNGVRLIEAFHCRFHPAFQTWLDWLNDPRLGRLRHIDAVFEASIEDINGEIRYRPALGGGALMDLGCYPVHWVLHSLGRPPVDVQARCALTSTGVDRWFQGQLRFDDGVTAAISTDMTPGTLRFSRLHAHFTDGEVLFESPIVPQEGGVLTRRTGDGEERAAIDSGTTYAHQLDAVCRALRQGDELPVEGDALLAQQRTIDRLYERAGVGYLRHAMAYSAHDRTR